MLGQTLRTWKRRRVCIASALALVLLAVGPAFRVDAASNSASNTWTFYSYWQGGNAGAWYVWTEQDNISVSYSVVGANTGAPTIYVTPTTIGYDISANYIYQISVPVLPGGAPR